MVDRVQLNKVKMHFNEKIVLDNINYSFNDAIYVIKGEKGSGKTALLKVIAGYMNNNAGKVEVTPGSVISYLFQDDMMFNDLTVKENLYIKSDAIHAKADSFDNDVKEAVKKFNISNLLNYKVSLLSSIEKKRLQLAALYLVNPDIILLDEPITNQDDKNQMVIIQEIEKYWGDKLIIMTTRQNVELGLPSVALELKAGKLVQAVS